MAEGQPPSQSDVQQVRRDIVVIGGSAGALDTMVQLVKRLPGDYPASLFIVSRVGHSASRLPELLNEAGALCAEHARHGEPIVPGHIYVAPPDRHMLLANHQVLLSRLPREHFTRPAIDPLFRSAARAFGTRVVGVVLSGSGSDGAVGLRDIKNAGGIVMVQDPSSVQFPEMPETALRTVPADYVLDSAALGHLLVTWSPRQQNRP